MYFSNSFTSPVDFLTKVQVCIINVGTCIKNLHIVLEFFWQACAISACGNFAIIGTEGGWIERFNLQSGISRGSYVDISESHGCAHDGEVVGVACDATNKIMISTGYHGDIKVHICFFIASKIFSCLVHHHYFFAEDM